MQKTMKKRGNGTGSIEVRKDRTNPFIAKVGCSVIDQKTGEVKYKYKRIGTFKTRFEAEYALQKYSENPFEYTVGEINTFSDLYNAWSKEYFEKLTSDSAIRSVESAYRYCSLLYDMPIKKIGPGHIKDVMSNGTWVVPEGKYKGEVRKTSKCTQERIKSMCNLMFDYAYERMLISFNPARAFKITSLLREIDKEKKVKQIFTSEDIQKMWKYVDVTPYTDMVLIGLYTGFRPQELAILEVDNVNLDEGYIIGGMKTTNGRNRKVPIHPDIKPLVQKRCYEATELFGSDRLFNDPRSQTGIRLTYDKYRRKFEFVMADLTLKGFSPHCTRHTFTTFAKKSGMEPGITKRILGHSLKSDVTEYYYTHPEFSDYKREIKKLSFA